jgi:singapore isolate B (sub-type 7) whole genome shotgun sequence assembly, scaffold_9
MSRFLLDDRANHSDSCYHGLFPSQLNFTLNQVSLYFLANTTSPHATPIMLNTIDTALWRTKKNDDSYDITVNNHPLPLNQATQEVTSQAVSLGISQDIVVALAFVPAYIVLFLVKEREVGMKHQEIISGMSIPAYWLSEFLWDTLTYCVVVVLEVLLMWLYGMDDYLKDGKAPALILLLFLYGTASTAFVSCIQFLFKSHTIGLIVVGEK